MPCLTKPAHLPYGLVYSFHFFFFFNEYICILICSSPQPGKPSSQCNITQAFFSVPGQILATFFSRLNLSQQTCPWKTNPGVVKLPVPLICCCKSTDNKLKATFLCTLPLASKEQSAFGVATSVAGPI